MSTVSIYSMFWYPDCTGVALEHEEGKTTCIPVRECELICTCSDYD